VSIRRRRLCRRLLTTAGYVKRLGHRPQSVAERRRRTSTTTHSARVRNDPADLGSNAGSYRPGPLASARNGAGPFAQVRPNKPGRCGTVRTCGAEGVGFEPTVGCPTHAFQACRFGRSRIPPRMPCRWSRLVGGRGTRDWTGYRVARPWPQVAAGSCATAAREPSQGREAAALSGSCGVPQTAWPPPGVTGIVCRGSARADTHVGRGRGPPRR
jgi:hypothetical protein